MTVVVYPIIPLYWNTLTLNSWGNMRDGPNKSLATHLRVETRSLGNNVLIHSRYTCKELELKIAQSDKIIAKGIAKGLDQLLLHH